MLKAFENVRKQCPLVHCITNYVTVTDCANIVLASGASPIMADDISEAADIASISSALVINIGTLNERTIKSMLAAGKAANAAGVPVVLDPVGAGASKLRKETTAKLLSEVKFSVIRGNMSEIMALYSGEMGGKGVDSAHKVDDSAAKMAQELSKRTGAVIAISGETDVIASADKVYKVKNGHSMMESITGSGCMLTALLGGFVGANKERVMEATAAAFAAMGIAGEQAYEKVSQKGEGTGSFRTYLIDAISLMDGSVFERRMKIE